MTTDPNDTRPTAHRLTVTPETMRRAEALGFKPGIFDVLQWALNGMDRWRDEWQRADALALALAERAAQLEAERDAARAGIGTMQEVVRNAAIDAMREYLPDFDGSRIDGGCTDGDEYDFTAAEVAQAVHAVGEALDEARAARDAARRDLARIVELCGWDCDGNDPESPSGAIHLYADAVQAVRELVEERAEDSREIVLLHRLCTEAADMLNEPTSAGGDAMDAMADRLRAAAGNDTNDRSA